MSELQEKCGQHPTGEAGFKSSVVRALIAKQIFGLLQPGANNHTDDPPTEFISGLGVDVDYSGIVNECANSIADGTCVNYVVRVGDQGVVVEGRHE